MTQVRYTREFRSGDSGSDVEAVGRALARANHTLRGFAVLPRRVRQTWGLRKQKQLKVFKRKHGLSADASYDRRTHEALSRFFDAKARKLIESYHPPEPLSERRFAALLAAMQDMDKHTPGYQYGGGHGQRLSSLDSHDRFDCSSSTSWVLHKAGLFSDDYAWVSGKFGTSYGNPGRGQYFTVYANPAHAWIRLHKSRWWRFDTSPYGDQQSPRSGAHLRYRPRLTWGFTARHFPGM